MSGVSLVYDATGLKQAEEKFKRLFDDPHGVLDAIGAMVESQTMRRIKTEKESPYGEQWPAWSPRYAASRHEGHGLLEHEGHLASSITHLVSGSDAVEVGSNLIYAAVHQMGYEQIPARPYLGLSDENRDDVLDIVDGFFRRALA